MKNKKAEEDLAREERKKERKRDKEKRRAEPILERIGPTRPQKPKILIVCGGKNTEPSYFKQFKLSSATIEVLGVGIDPLSIVEYCLRVFNENKHDEAWCVFDKDNFPDNNFNGAIEKAKSNGIGIAYSNQAFEYWLILHLEDHQGGGMHRKEYNKKINEYINPMKTEYDGKGDKIVSQDFFDILLEIIDEKTEKRRVDLAIERAEKIYNKFDHSSPAKEESSTTVFILVKRILGFL